MEFSTLIQPQGKNERTCRVCHKRVAVGVQCAICAHWYHCSSRQQCVPTPNAVPFFCDRCQTSDIAVVQLRHQFGVEGSFHFGDAAPNEHNTAGFSDASDAFGDNTSANNRWTRGVAAAGGAAVATSSNNNPNTNNDGLTSCSSLQAKNRQKNLARLRAKGGRRSRSGSPGSISFVSDNENEITGNDLDADDDNDEDEDEPSNTKAAAAAVAATQPGSAQAQREMERLVKLRRRSLMEQGALSVNLGASGHVIDQAGGGSAAFVASTVPLAQEIVISDIFGHGDLHQQQMREKKKRSKKKKKAESDAVDADVTGGTTAGKQQQQANKDDDPFWNPNSTCQQILSEHRKIYFGDPNVTQGMKRSNRQEVQFRISHIEEHEPY